MTVAAILMGAASAGAHDRNGDAVAQAKHDDHRARHISRKLHRRLHLHRYAGAARAFEITGDGRCTIDVIVVGQAVAQYAPYDWTLVSPDGGAAVKVGFFQGTPEYRCLRAVRRALHW